MIIAILDNVRSALNVGSVLRTSDSLGIDEVWLCGITAIPPSKEIHKTALGAELSVKWRYFSKTIEAVDELIACGFEVVAVEQCSRSENLRNFSINKTLSSAFVLGNEVDGVSPEVLDKCHRVVEIEQRGIKKSLNVSVAAGIVLFEVTK